MPFRVEQSSSHLELRDLARLELGDQFDLSVFHNVILTNGLVPLDILEDLVRQYIASTIMEQQDTQ